MDLLKQMKRISIPIFDGNKSTYESWKAAFTACIDQAPATPEYKLLQLRQHLTGEALKCIENLGHSAGAYESYNYVEGWHCILSKWRVSDQYNVATQKIWNNLQIYWMLES